LEFRHSLRGKMGSLRLRPHRPRRSTIRAPIWFIDTSALLRYFVEDDPAQAQLERAVDKIFDGGEDLYFTPQVARESWAVLTRRRTLAATGRTPEEASLFLRGGSQSFRFPNGCALKSTFDGSAL